MPTYDELRLRPDSMPVWWYEPAGTPWMFTTDPITAANIATLFGDGYTETLTPLRILQKPKHTDSKRLEPFAVVPDGGFQVTILDERSATYPAGIATWIFGRDRPGILTGRLAADVDLHVGGAGHDWTLADGSVFASLTFPTPLYCGLETIEPQTRNVNLLEDVVRSLYLSEAYAHRGKAYGSTTLYPFVTDHPTVWKGRIGTLFHTLMDGEGKLASTDGTIATVRAEARVVRGFIEGMSFTPTTRTIRMKGIESVLDREMCRKLPRARLGVVINVGAFIGEIQQDPGVDAAADDPGMVMSVELDDFAGNILLFPIFITPQYYSAGRFIQAINDVLDAGPTSVSGGAFVGQLQIDMEDERIVFRYFTDAVTPMLCTVFLDNTLPGHGATWANYWSKILGEQPSSIVVVTPEENVQTSEEYTRSLDRFDTIVVPRQDENGDDGAGFQLRVEAGPGDSPLADFEGDWGGSGDGYVAIESVDGVEIVYVAGIDTGIGIITVDRRIQFQGSRRLDHVATPEEPVIVRRVYVTPQSAGVIPVRAVLRPLLSTGVAGYNDADYDTLAEGIGIGIPNETRNAGAATDEGLIDIASFERFFAEVAPYFNSFTYEVIEEPTKVRDWLRARLAFLGGSIVVENGKIGARRTIMVPFHEGREVTPDHILDAPRTTGEDRLEGVLGGVHYHWHWNRTLQKFRQNALVTPYDAGEPQPTNVPDIEDKGIAIDLDQVALLGQEVLAEYGLEGTEYQVTLTRAHRDLEPGMAVRFTDWGGDSDTDRTQEYRGMPNREGGRGHNAIPMLCIAASVEQESGRVTATLLRQGRKRGGYSPTAWIETFVVDTPGAGTTRIVYTDRVFSDLDAEGFIVGELVEVLRASCTTAAVQVSDNGGAGHTITAIDLANRRIEITPNIAGAGIVSGETLILIHAPHQTAGQVNSAKLWAAIGDNSGDIGDTGTACFGW